MIFPRSNHSQDFVSPRGSEEKHPEQSQQSMSQASPWFGLSSFLRAQGPESRVEISHLQTPNNVENGIVETSVKLLHLHREVVMSTQIGKSSESE